jgi:hypothetical protein
MRAGRQFREIVGWRAVFGPEALRGPSRGGRTPLLTTPTPPPQTRLPPPPPTEKPKPFAKKVGGRGAAGACDQP